MMHRYILPLPLLLLAACSEPSPSPMPEPRSAITEIVSSQAGFAQSYVGTIAARTETDLGFPIAGTLVSRWVDEGDVVKRGATLALMDPQSLDAEVRAAGAGVEVAEAQLDSAEDTARRSDQLALRGVDSAAAAEAAKSALVAAQAGLDQARASLVQSEQLRGYATLTAPQDGVITKAYVEQGAALTAGQAVVRLAATNDREVLLDLSEKDASLLKPGAAFRIRLEADPQFETTASLRIIDPVADAATRSQRLHLTLPDTATAMFRLGTLVSIDLDARAAAQLSLPATALIGGGPAVWVIDPAGRVAHERPIVTAEEKNGRITILSGLASGEEVIIKGSNSIKDGQTIGARVM